MKRAGPVLVALLLATGGMIRADDPVGDVPPPKHWDRFTMLVW
jgi:hypothetical protein